LQRHEQAARGAEARRDRRRRQWLMEGSFGRAANEHGFKRSRWRRRWRQEIQDWLIAAVQNVKLLLRAGGKRIESGAAAVRAVVLAVPRSGRVGRASGASN